MVLLFLCCGADGEPGWVLAGWHSCQINSATHSVAVRRAPAISQCVCQSSSRAAGLVQPQNMRDQTHSEWRWLAIFGQKSAKIRLKEGRWRFTAPCKRFALKVQRRTA